MSDVAVSYAAGASPYPEGPAAAAPSGKSILWKGDSFSFHDLLDVINPLQHLPVIGTIYRWVTGDTIGNAARVVGDTLFGGPIGAATGLFGAVLKQETGKDVGEHVIALFDGHGSDHAPANTAVADAATPPAGAAPPDHADGKIQVSAVELAAAPQPATAFPVAFSGAGPGIPINRAAPVMGISGSHSVAEQAFLDQNAKMLGNRSKGPQRPIVNTVIPLQLTGTPLPSRRGISSPSAPAQAQNNSPAITPATLTMTAPVTSAAGQAAGTQPTPALVSAAAQAAAPNTAGLPGQPPLEISQKMLEALDRYMKMQQDRDGATAPPSGGQVDVHG